LVAAGLPCLPVHAAPKSQRTNTALLAFPAASRAEEELARRLRQSKPERHVESLPTGVRAAASRWLEGAVSLVYPAAVLDVDLLPTLARVQFQCPESHCVVVGADAVGGLPCVSRLSDAHRKLEAGSATDLSDSKAPNTTLTCAQLLEAVSLAMTQPQEPAPFVLHIAPAWAGAGSSHVFATQLEWLHECGFNVVCLHLDTDDLEANQNKGAVATRLRSLPGGRALHRWFLSRPAAQKALEQSTQIVGPYKYFSLEGEERVSRQVSIPDSLHQFLKRRKIHFVLLNYGHNWPMIDRLGLEATPIILETHDVRPVQHGLYNKAPTLDSAVAVEMEMFARASCAVFINDEEHSRFSEAHRRVPAVSAFPFRDQAEAIPLQSRFETPASTVLRALGLPFDIVEELFRPREQRRCRFAVFVGSTHKANVFSLDWFLTQVYPLGLMDPRLVILIVGTVGEALVDLDLPNVYCTGRLSDLQPVYAAADVILLPIRIGTGLPIKSLDALTAGAPFVATSAAISAVPGLVDAVGVFDSPEAFASRVMELAFDADAELTFRNNVKLLKQKSANWAAYTSVWGRALQGLALPQPLSVRCPPDAMNLAPFRESPAGPGGGEYYFWRGHGLTEIAGAEVRDHGIEILEPYSRLGLQCWTSGIQADRLRLSFLLRADAPVRCILALDGKVQGSLILQSDPLTVFLDLALTAGASCRSISLELRLEGAAAGFGAVVLSSLVARPSEVSILEASHV
jgi:glycosyltransferase involved in cell wall biosynthesis